MKNTAQRGGWPSASPSDLKVQLRVVGNTMAIRECEWCISWSGLLFVTSDFVTRPLSLTGPHLLLFRSAEAPAPEARLESLGMSLDRVQQRSSPEIVAS